MGFYIIYAALIASCGAAIMRPAYGCIAFYLFVTLDPAWNWHWAFPVDPGFQKWIAIATLIGFAFQMKQIRFFTIESKYATLALVAFFVLAFTSATNSLFQDRGFFYLNVLWRVLLMVVISLLTITDRKTALYLAFACILGQGYNSLRINEDYFRLGYCRYATIANWSMKGLDNNGYSILTIPLMAISMGFAFAPVNWKLRIVAGGIAILQVHQLMLMESRGGMLGAMLTLVICAWYVPKSMSTIWVLVAGFIVGSALAGPPVVKEFASVFKKQGERDASAESRFHLWKAGAEIVADYPLLGVGPDASRFYVLNYFEFNPEPWRTDKALHNLFFEVSCDNGLPAAAIYFSYFLFSWYSIWRSRKALLRGDPISCALALSVLAGVPGYFLASMFSSGSLIETSYILPILGCALLSYKLSEQTSYEQSLVHSPALEGT